MATISSVHHTFEALISEAKRAQSELQTRLRRAAAIQNESEVEANQILTTALQATPSPAQWVTSPLTTKALALQQTILQDWEKAKIELQQATPADAATDRLTLERLSGAYQAERGRVSDLQGEIMRTISDIPSDFRLRWGEKLLTPARADLLAIMTPPPSRWNVLAYLRVSEDQRAMWAILGPYERRHGEGSLARLVKQVGELQATSDQKEAQCKTMKPEMEQLGHRLERYDQLKTRWDRQPDLAIQQQQAVFILVSSQPRADILAWLNAQAPNQVKPYTFVQAKSSGASRVATGLQSHVEAIGKIISKLQAPMAKLKKGLRHAPSKSIYVDESKIARQVREALTNMKPMDASADAALQAISGLRVEPASVSQARFYQRAQADTSANNTSWLLMWLLLDGQFNPGVAMLAGANPALALGLAAVLPQWDQQNWDSINTSTPAYLPSVDVPESASSVPDTWVPDVPTPALDIPSGPFDLSISSMDIPVNVDLPSMDLSLPTIDIGIPDISLPSMDISVPDIQISMPDIQVDTSSFLSGGGSDFSF